MTKGVMRMNLSKYDGQEWCFNCGKELQNNVYRVNVEAPEAMDIKKIVFCINCAIDVGELGKVGEQDERV